MIWLGLGAVTIGTLLIAQEFSDTVDALVPDVIIGPVGGAIVIVAGLVLVYGAVR